MFAMVDEYGWAVWLIQLYSADKSPDLVIALKARDVSLWPCRCLKPIRSEPATPEVLIPNSDLNHHHRVQRPLVVADRLILL